MNKLLLDDQDRKNEKFQAINDFKVLWPYLKEFKFQLIVCIVLFGFSTVGTIGVPYSMGLVIDKSLTDGSNFWTYFLFFCGCYLIMIIFSFLQNYIFLKLGQRALYNLRVDIQELLFRLPLKFFDTNSSGKIISRSVNDVTGLAVLFNSKFFSTMSEAATIIGSLAALTLISPLCGGFLSIYTILLIFFLFKFMGEAGKKMIGFRSISSRINSFVGDTVNGLEIIFASNYHSFWIPKYLRFMRLFKVSIKRVIFAWAKFPTVHTIAIGLSYSTVIFICYNQVQSGVITSGQFVAILTYVSFILNPFHQISGRFNEFQTAMSSMNKINQILSLKDEREIDVSVGGMLLIPGSDINFENLKFGYDSENALFDGFNCTIPGEKTTAIIGRTGSGKTSLIGLICKLYPWQGGDIKIGDFSLQDLSKESLYSHVGVVTQQLFIFEDTIRENLRLYDESIDDERISNVLAEIKLDKKINSLEKGLDSFFDKSSDIFSVGEKQLIIIGRMLLRDPKILIFDEATASLDNHSEFLVQNACQKLFRGRTTIIIAHRLSTIQMAQNIVVLDSGKIVEEGAPDKLIENKGAYYDYLQFLSDE
ncbi:MAG: ABC transporter ATP-binding protein [Bacteriovoracaceae bacterium]|jgi:ABC-type multidrug transport system fused ATPase/permease subunit|nr:ABC transporter ATP-binding protein [Bacteriovoracaceae bacterium]